MRKLRLLLSIFAFAAVVTSCAGTPDVYLVESGEVLANWQEARKMQATGRYELAREYYLLALAATRSEDTQEALGRELAVVDRQIKTLR